MTQEVVAKQAGLSADTIRRLENEEFSPSLRTILRVVRAFDMRVSTLFLGYELDDGAKIRELSDLLVGRSEADIALVYRLVRSVLQELDAYRGGRIG